MLLSSYLLAPLAAAVLSTAATVPNQCPPLGAVLPAPQQPSKNQNVTAAVASIMQRLTSFTSSYNTTALSLGVQSIHESQAMIDFHYTPPLLNKTGTTNVTADTVYRLASLSKLYTALAILQLHDKIRLSDPVTWYLPELEECPNGDENDIDAVQWSDVTIDALLSHLAGISEDIGDQDLANMPGNWEGLGLPKLASDQSAQCGATSTQRGCTKEDFFKYLPRKHPVYAPFSKTVYSNNGYAILGLVIEAVTGQPYSQYMQEHVFKPLGLSETYVGKPSNSTSGFIPVGDSWWSTDLAVDNPSGGLYSSTRDLLSLGKSILEYKALPPARTRRWMKPTSFTSSTGTYVGQAWEIARADNVTADNRLIDFYTKSGNLYDYSSILVLIPDDGLVISILSAGDDSGEFQLQAILSELVRALLPAIEMAGKAEAQAIYSGSYSISQANETVSMVLAVDDGPGLLVKNFTSRGQDFLASYEQIIESGVSPEMRLYPTGLTAGHQSSWRAVYNTIPDPAAVDSLLFFPQGSCQTWSVEDLLSYGLVALDDFVFTLNSNKTKAEKLNARALRADMSRIG